MRAPLRLHTLGLALICAGAMACKGGGGSPNSPSNSTSTTGSSTASCRTGSASQRSVQTFPSDGTTVTSDTTCSVSGSDVTCNGTYVDSRFGPGTISQTSRFSSRADIVDEVAVNPPLTRSTGTTTVITQSGVPFTTTATNSYDAQRRLVSTVVATQSPPLSVTTTFTAWDASGRPTTGSTTIPNVGVFPVTNTYDNAARTVRRDTGLNVCTQTHDANGNIVGESCTGTTPSTTTVNIITTTQICK